MPRFLAARSPLPAGLLIVVAAAGPLLATSSRPGLLAAAGPAVSRLLADLPLSFVENRGQVAGPARFSVTGADKSLFFAPDGVTIRLRNGHALANRPETSAERASGWTLRLEFAGAHPQPELLGEERGSGAVSFFRGRPDAWKTGVPTYGAIRYRELWPGIDLVYRGDRGRLKYEFQLQPGADPARIQLRYRGATGVRLDPAGSLEIETPAQTLVDEAPFAYQELADRRVPVSCSYRLQEGLGFRVRGSAGAHLNPGTSPTPSTPPHHSPLTTHHSPEVRFEVGAYDKTKPLIIDPAVLVYCGFLGGDGDDQVTGIGVDATGNTYVCGVTTSSSDSFPVKVGPFYEHDSYWETDAFVARVKADGSGFDYCGFLGGDGSDAATALAVDARGNAYVVGWTTSSEDSFPVLVGPGLHHRVDDFRNFLTHGWVARLRPDGRTLDYSGFIGGAADDEARAVAFDSSGCAYVGGITNSPEASFPVTGGPDGTYNGRWDGWIAKVAADGTGLLACGYVGGARYDTVSAVGVGPDGRVWAAGATSSLPSTFPVTGNLGPVYQGGITDAWIARFSPDALALEQCGYLGGAREDAVTGLALDVSGRVYLSGETSSPQDTFPVRGGPDLTYNGRVDAFVARLTADGSLDYCGYLGGRGIESACAIAVDPQDRAWLAGAADSRRAGFPIRNGPDSVYNGGALDGWVACVAADGQSLECCGYLGSKQPDAACAIAADAAGGIYLGGWTFAPAKGFPRLAGPAQPHVPGRRTEREGWIAKLAAPPEGGAPEKPR